MGGRPSNDAIHVCAPETWCMSVKLVICSTTKSLFQRISGSPSADWQRHLAWRSPAAILMHARRMEARRHTGPAVKLYRPPGGCFVSESRRLIFTAFCNNTKTLGEVFNSLGRAGRTSTASARTQRRASGLTRSSNHLSKCPSSSLYVSALIVAVRLEPAARSTHTSAERVLPRCLSLAATDVGNWAAPEFLSAVFTLKTQTWKATKQRINCILLFNNNNCTEMHLFSTASRCRNVCDKSRWRCGGNLLYKTLLKLPGETSRRHSVQFKDAVRVGTLDSLCARLHLP